MNAQIYLARAAMRRQVGSGCGHDATGSLVGGGLAMHYEKHRAGLLSGRAQRSAMASRFGEKRSCS